MISINSLSGGESSSYMAVENPADYDIYSLVCINDKRCSPKDKAVIRYVNYKLQDYSYKYGEFIATAEDDKSIVAMMDLEQYLGRKITWVRGISYDDLIDEGSKTRLPSWARRYCTDKMKIAPIFEWWFKNIGKKVEMRIGFRFDEFDRMLRFFNNSDPGNYSIPIACNTYGKKRQQHENFNWRFCSFPLIKNSITKSVVNEYWKKNGIILGDLFTSDKKIEFPVISNCVGCFHKKQETLAAMCSLHPEKMNWFAEQEKKNMGTWLDSMLTYENIILNQNKIRKEALYEIMRGQSCDSSGCAD